METRLCCPWKEGRGGVIDSKSSDNDNGNQSQSQSESVNPTSEMITAAVGQIIGTRHEILAGTSLGFWDWWGKSGQGFDQYQPRQGRDNVISHFVYAMIIFDSIARAWYDLGDLPNITQGINLHLYNEPTSIGFSLYIIKWPYWHGSITPEVLSPHPHLPHHRLHLLLHLRLPLLDHPHLRLQIRPHPAPSIDSYP